MHDHKQQKKHSQMQNHKQQKKHSQMQNHKQQKKSMVICKIINSRKKHSHIQKS